jgi:hypothetical protein
MTRSCYSHGYVPYTLEWRPLKDNLADTICRRQQLLHVAYCGVIITGTAYGLGSHIETVSQRNLVISLKLLYIGNWFVIWAIAVSKTSFAMTLLALVVKRWHVWLLWFSIISLNVIMGVDALMQFTQCTPVDRTWDLSVPGSCWDTRIVINYTIFAGGNSDPIVFLTAMDDSADKFTTAAWSAFLDFLLAMVPWLLFRDMKMMAAEKAGLIVAMSLGLL